MGESTARLCLLHFIHGVFQHEEYCSVYFHSMSSADAKHVEAMHFEQHGIHGMAGSLDCSHIRWNNCPVAHQRHFKGKEEQATIIMEVACDYNLYAWHAVVGYAGTFNDINVRDSSLLHKSLVDGSFERNDFEFQIAGMTFSVVALGGWDIPTIATSHTSN
jgi:hypothetical protein